MSKYIVQSMNIEIASKIVKWVYEDPYSIYNFYDTREAIEELVNQNYHAVFESNNLIGYFCFGYSARIPTEDDVAYSIEALDIGLGMKPEICGKGLGYDFLKAGLTFAKENFIGEKQVIRLTVAEFNQRAVNLYGKAGFVHSKIIKHSKTGNKFYIMQLTV